MKIIENSDGDKFIDTESITDAALKSCLVSTQRA